jgi:hypothetical protein
MRSTLRMTRRPRLSMSCSADDDDDDDDDTTYDRGCLNLLKPSGNFTCHQV